MTPWHKPPVFFDIETQSAADLKLVGGRAYAMHETTRVLTFVALIDGVYHVWIPQGGVGVKVAELWPSQLGPRGAMELHHGPDLPPPIAQAASERLFIAHNCWGFDAHVWKHCIPGPLPAFGDTLPIARAAGLAGRLDALAAALFEGAKDNGQIILKRYMGKPEEVPPTGALEVIARYNLADVALLARAWDELDCEIEADVLDAHRAINDRGVAVDWHLFEKIQRVAITSVARAGARIAELTKTSEKPEGVLNSTNIRSVKQVQAWLASQGLRVRDYTGKTTLRREFVEQAIANPWMMLHDDAPFDAVKNIKPAVFDVLKLRAASLRITGAKAERGMARTIDGRIYDLFSYHQAHTGRWSSVGVQVHNLPRLKKGVNLDKLIAMHESGEWTGTEAADYDRIAATLGKSETGRPLTVDDALGSLLRPAFVAAPGKALLIADYNAIECRGLAWIAGEEWLLDAFRSKTDPYKKMARMVFGLADDAPVTDEQRQVGKVIVLGCGYGMSAEKFAIFCGLSGVDLDAAGVTAEQCVDAYRKAHPMIAGRYAGEINGRAHRRGGVWDQLNAAAFAAVAEGRTGEAGKCRWSFDGKTLVCELPSGRKLRYRNARIEDRVPGYALRLGLDKTKATLVYDRPQGGSASLYGGKLAENVVQAVCRDVFATAIVNLEAALMPIVMHTHDEILDEVDATGPDDPNLQTALERFVGIMATPPSWATGFPLAVEGHAAPRYLKKPPAGWPKAEARG